MLKQLDSLPGDPVELRAVSQLLASEVKALTLKVEQLKHQLAGHNRHRFGSNSESLDQLGLAFAEDEQIAEATQQKPPVDDEPSDKPSGKHGRKPLPGHLERREELLTPGEDCASWGRFR